MPAAVRRHESFPKCSLPPGNDTEALVFLSSPRMGLEVPPWCDDDVVCVRSRVVARLPCGRVAVAVTAKQDIGSANLLHGSDVCAETGREEVLDDSEKSGRKDGIPLAECLFLGIGSAHRHARCQSNPRGVGARACLSPPRAQLGRAQ
jgi:hypothetical protein